MASIAKRIPQWLVELAGDYDSLDDGEVSSLGVGGGGLRDDAHHQLVLSVRLVLPRLDVTGPDEVEEGVGFQMNGAGRAPREDLGNGGLPRPGGAAQNQYGCVVGDDGQVTLPIQSSKKHPVQI